MRHPANKYIARMAATEADRRILVTAIGNTLRLDWCQPRYPAAYLLQRITEAQVQAAVLDTLAALKIEAWPSDVGAAKLRGRVRGMLGDLMASKDLEEKIMRGSTGAGGKGLPDISGYMPDGRALYVECKAPEWRERVGLVVNGEMRARSTIQKRPAGKLKPEQRAFIERAIAANCCAGVVWQVQDLAQFLPDEYARRLG